MKLAQKTLSMLLVFSLMFSTFAPVGHAAKRAKKSKPALLQNLPAFPEDAVRAEIDWSQIDWDQEVTRIEDEQAYLKQVRELDRLGKYEEAQALRVKTVKLGDDEVMKKNKVPAEVQDLVREYKKDKSSKAKKVEKKGKVKNLFNPAEARKKKQELSEKIKRVQKKKDVSSNKPEELNELEGIKIIDISKEIPVKTGKLKKMLKEEVRIEEKTELKNLKQEERQEKRKARFKFSAPKKKKKFSFIPTAYAATPLMPYYEGIEAHTVEHILYYLEQNQNTDGSFGDRNKYELTTELALILADFVKQNTDVFTDLSTYLVNAEPTNNRELAQKIRMMVSLSESYQTYLDQLLLEQNSDGGVAFQPGYESDLETTLEFLWALLAANQESSQAAADAFEYVFDAIDTNGAVYYEDEANPNYFLMNKVVRHLSVFTGLVGGVSIEDKMNQVMTYIENQYDADTETFLDIQSIDDEIYTLRNLRLLDRSPDMQKALFEKLQSYQGLNGSFGSMFTTIFAAKAFAQADIEVISIVPTTTLQTHSAASFDITYKNVGYAFSSPVNIKFFTDGYAASTLATSIALPVGAVGITSTTYQYSHRFTGDTEFLVYAESEDEFEYEKNWKREIFSFAVDPLGEPALPMYFIAQKYVNAQGFGFNIRWPLKDDPNRSAYTVAYRKQGETEWNQMHFGNSWSGAFIFSSEEFVEGDVYEFTVGARNLAENESIIFADPVTVKLTANDDLYNGSVEGYMTNNEQRLAGMGIWGYGSSTTTDYDGSFSVTDYPNGNTALWVFEDQYEKLITDIEVPVDGITTDQRIYTRLKDDSELPVIQSFEIRFQEDFQMKNQREVQLWVNATDNVALENADFYLYNPTTSYWEYLGTSEVSTDDAFLDWSIPAEYLGTGFKVKSVVHDFRGNSSLEQEWGPFEITDGTEPTGTVEIQGLTESTWNLGESKTITWDIQTTNPLDRIDVKLFTDGNSYNLVQGLAPTETTYNYTVPLSASYASTAAYMQVTACDTGDNCGTMQSDTFAIVDNSPMPQEPWGPPSQFNLDIDSPGLYRGMVDFYSHTDGSTSIVYTETEVVDSNPYTEDRKLVYRKLGVNDVWQNPVILEQYTYISGQNYGVSWWANVVWSSDTTAHIVYEKQQSSSLDDMDVYYRRIESGSLVESTRITNSSTRSREADVAQYGSDIYVTWREGYSYTSESGTTTLRLKEKVSGSWSAEQQLSVDSTGFQGLVKNGSAPTVFYSQESMMHVRSKVSGSWNTQVGIMRNWILKEELDRHTADLDKFSTIVENDPNNADRYLWVSAVTDRDALESILQTEGFVNESAIRADWSNNQYLYSSLDFSIFELSPNNYDFIFRNREPSSDWRDQLQFLDITIDPVGLTSTVNDHKVLVDLDGDEGVTAVDTHVNNQGDYHIAYIQGVNGTSDNHAYYLFFDGVNKSSEAYISSMATDVGEGLMRISGRDNNISAMFVAYIGGESVLAANSADFTDSYADPISAVYPLTDDITFFSPTLEWDATSANITDYDLYLGLGKNDLDLIASGLTEKTHQTFDLEKSTTYYWRVVGNTASGKSYSPVWSFVTVENAIEPVLEFTSPQGITQSVNDEFTLSWTDTDPDSSAMISLYYDMDGSGFDGVLIAENIAEDDALDSYSWSMQFATEGDYYIYAAIQDESHDPVMVYAPGYIEKRFVDCEEPATGDWSIDESCVNKIGQMSLDRNTSIIGSIWVYIQDSLGLKVERGYNLHIERGSQIKVERGE